jgi:beta-N-acetylhexosaminidase
VAATVKHFPGLGAASQPENTDLRPVRLNVPAKTLRAVDEAPFRAAVAAGVRLVMVSWAVYPALDPAHPAGLSPAIVGGELRRRLGFHGVTITDGIEAGALAPYGSIGRRATLAARAGMDLMLCSGQEFTEGGQARGALLDAYRGGTLPAGAFRAAVQRVITLRTLLAHHRP